MASFAFFDSFTTAQTLADGEFGFIGEAGSLVVDGDAIFATGDVIVSVFGLLSSTENAVDYDDTGTFVLNVGRTGRVEAQGFDAVVVDDAVTAFVSNEGRIVSSFDALDISGAGSISIVNNGLLVGDSDGIVSGSTDLTRIVNNGTIDGFGGGINHLGGDSLLINRGTIRKAEFFGFSGAADNDEVRNTGSIRGGVFMEGDDDIVFNRGVIDFVNLGIGDDYYIGRADGRANRVDGRDGDDTFVSSRAADDFRGGTGADHFFFLRRGGDDRIADFGGQDVIDLSTLGFDRFADLRSLIEDRPTGSLIDLSDQDLTIFLTGVDKADLRASDFLLEPTIM